MDALALLCTLHADGPTTLRELRSAGCRDLSDLVGSDVHELAEFLRTSVASAERFQREARLLGERMELLEPEGAPAEHAHARPEHGSNAESPVDPKRAIPPLPAACASPRAHRSWFNATRVPLPAGRPRRDEYLSASAPGAIALPGPAEIEPDPSTERESAPEAPASAPPSATEPPPEVPPAHRDAEVATASAATTVFVEPEPSLVRGAELVPFRQASPRSLFGSAEQRARLPRPEPAVRASDPAPSPGATPLEVGQLDDLDESLLAALASAGVRTAEELVEASGLQLSRRISIPFTRLLELQLEAQHLVRRAPAASRPTTARARAAAPTRRRRHTDAASAEPPTERELSPSAESEADADAGGPFA